jgi:hypothetical protein
VTNADHQARAELIFGGLCELPPEAPGKDNVNLVVDFATFERLAKYWSELPVPSRPRLRGISLSRADESEPRLVLVLDAGGRAPFFVVSAPLKKDSEMFRLSTVWPYAGWWEEELSRFSGLTFSGSAPESEARWLQS